MWKEGRGERGEREGTGGMGGREGAIITSLVKTAGLSVRESLAPLPSFHKCALLSFTLLPPHIFPSSSSSSLPLPCIS